MNIQALDGETLSLRTGDELLCSGNGKLSKAIIASNVLFGAQGQSILLSHVAKYIAGFTYEATTLNAWCNKKGYQKNPFTDWLDNYDGIVWVRQTEGCEIDEESYIEYADSLIGTPYEHGIMGPLELILTSFAVKTPLLHQFARKHLKTKSLHCSEGCVKESQAGGYFDLNVRANKMPPYTFWTGGKYEQGFIKGRLLEPKRIK